MHICGRIRFYTTIWIHPYNRECEWRYETRWNPNSVVPSVVGYSRFYHNDQILQIFSINARNTYKTSRNVWAFSFKTDISQRITSEIEIRIITMRIDIILCRVNIHNVHTSSFRTLLEQ